MGAVVNLSRKQLAESVLMLDGKQFSLDEYPFYNALYEGIWPDTLLMCGRQVGKSVSAASFTVCEAIAIPHFKTLYISPTHKQTTIFSNTRVAKLIHHSKDLKQLMGDVVTDNVLLKVLGNGSELIFNYAEDDPDRVRGISADRVIYDEVQDINYEAVVPVVNECMANSKYGYVSYMGTPKTSENTIEFLWQHSTQSEWCVKCDACSKYSFYRDTRGVDKKGLVCLHCNSVVNVRNGIWVDMRTESDKSLIRAFHVPQVILPANQEPDRWKRILNKLDTYSESKFQNEVMGVSDSIGSRLISLEELKSACSPSVSPSGFVVGGVDWSGGGSKGFSRTVAVVMSRNPGGKFVLLDYKIFPNQNPVDTINDIVSMFSRYNVSLVIGDAGEGALANSLLSNKMPGGKPVYQLQYGSQSKPLTWNNVDRYTCDRTTLIDCFFYDIKKGAIEFPKYEFMKDAFTDYLAEFEETTTSGKKVWRHSPTSPDDALHASVFAWIGCKILTHDLTFY